MNEARQQQGSYHRYFLAKWRSLTSTEKFIAVGASAYVGLAVGKASLVGTLRCIGFSSIGPVANSWAAAWQSAVATAAGGGGGGGGGGRHHAAQSAGAALFSWAQHVAMTWHIFTPSAAVVGIIAAIYFSSGYVAQSARSVLRAGIFGGEEASTSLLVRSGSGGYEVEGPIMMEVDQEEAVVDTAPDLISLEEGSGGV
ncbi:hypothetical protein NADE_008338 [Nannochloris sp. 'desiccata']|nr:hypothetical protein KSW81_000225 [Chlorella desiccata (nom. nud.)]KAH7620063.1 hypothetical protein NADE_008338 [Chlorella desiccata (nom. nud.)]